MVCDSFWLDKFYYTPIKIINKEIANRIVPGRQISPAVEMEFSLINSSNQQPINANQNTPYVNIFGEYPIQVPCKFCKSLITTKIEREFDCHSCCCCFITGICYIFFLAALALGVGKGG